MIFWSSLCIAGLLTVLIFWQLPIMGRFGIRACRFVVEKTATTERLLQNEPPPGSNLDVATLTAKRYHVNLERFADGSAVYRALYVLTRLVAGLSAGLLPFVVSSWPRISLALSVCIVVAVVLDRVFTPRTNLELNLVAEQKLLELINVKLLDEELRSKLFCEIVTNFNNGRLKNLTEMEFVMSKIQIQAQK
jgi:hypothetical protein